MSGSRLFESPDGTITVDRADGVTSLRFNGRLQSAMSGPEGLDTIQPYLEYLHLTLAACPSARSALIIGLGGGVLPKRMLHDYPEMVIDVIEIDAVVVEIARRFFGLPTDPRLNVIVGDGRRILVDSLDKYDIIVVDAYHEVAIPRQLATIEFVETATAHLTDVGVLAYNFVGVVAGRGNEPLRRLVAGVRRTLCSTFVFPVGLDCGSRRQNIVIMGTRAPLSRGLLRERITSRVAGAVRVPRFETFGDQLLERLDLRGARPLHDSDLSEDVLLRG